MKDKNFLQIGQKLIIVRTKFSGEKIEYVSQVMDIDENENLAAELERKREDLMKAHKEILDLRKEYTLLQTANGLGGSDENRQFSRKHLNKIVREIDKCLALLSE